MSTETTPVPMPAVVHALACETSRGAQPFTLADYPPPRREATAAPALLLAHGAGGNRESAFMLEVARVFTAHGLRVLLFNFPYAEAGRKPPDRAPTLLAAYRAALAAVRRLHPQPAALLVGGKSMGGRYAAQVAADEVGRAAGVAGVLYLGYPLHPPGKPECLRTDGLADIAASQLFVQGERDAFGTPQELAPLVASLPRAGLHAVPGGNHSLERPRRDGVPLADTLAGVVRELWDWVLGGRA